MRSPVFFVSLANRNSANLRLRTVPQRAAEFDFPLKDPGGWTKSFEAFGSEKFRFPRSRRHPSAHDRRHCARSKGTGTSSPIRGSRRREAGAHAAETVCKHMLSAQAVAYEDGDELPRLYRSTAETLHIAPGDGPRR